MCKVGRVALLDDSGDDDMERDDGDGDGGMAEKEVVMQSGEDEG